MWQLEGSGAWQETPDVDPEAAEGALIENFVRAHGARPFANRKLGKAPK